MVAPQACQRPRHLPRPPFICLQIPPPLCLPAGPRQPTQSCHRRHRLQWQPCPRLPPPPTQPSLRLPRRTGPQGAQAQARYKTHSSARLDAGCELSHPRSTHLAVPAPLIFFQQLRAAVGALSWAQLVWLSWAQLVWLSWALLARGFSVAMAPRRCAGERIGRIEGRGAQGVSARCSMGTSSTTKMIPRWEDAAWLHHGVRGWGKRPPPHCPGGRLRSGVGAVAGVGRCTPHANASCVRRLGQKPGIMLELAATCWGRGDQRRVRQMKGNSETRLWI